MSSGSLSEDSSDSSLLLASGGGGGPSNWGILCWWDDRHCSFLFEDELDLEVTAGKRQEGVMPGGKSKEITGRDSSVKFEWVTPLLEETDSPSTDSSLDDVLCLFADLSTIGSGPSNCVMSVVPLVSVDAEGRVAGRLRAMGTYWRPVGVRTAA